MSECWGMLGLLRSVSDHESVLQGAAAACGMKLELPETIPEALAVLKLKTTRALVVDAAAEGAEDLCHMARHHRFPGDVAVLVGSHMMTDAAFTLAYSWGADDVVSLDSERAISTRLTHLPRQVVLPRGARRSALIVNADTRIAARISRALGYAGYDVERVERPESALEQASRDGFELLILSSGDNDIPEVVKLLRESAGTPAVLVWARPDEFESLTKALDGFERVSVLSSATPVENILFASNELVYQRENLTARANRRLLHGVTVAFREPGADEHDHGFTYNIGRNGMYVRTLALPAKDRVDLELRQPGTRQKIRLAGKVVWRRAFGFAGLAVAPPGFGLQICEETGTDHELWSKHFDEPPPTEEAAAEVKPPEPAVAPGVSGVGSASTPQTTSPSETPAPGKTASESTSLPANPKPALSPSEAEPAGTPDSERWFVTYSEPPAGPVVRSSHPPAAPTPRPRPSRWPGILLATVLVLLLFALTFYLYSHTGTALSLGF